MKLPRLLLSLACVAAFASAGPALAHPKLVSSNPSANATVAKPARIALTFSEKLLAPMSGAQLIMTGMPGTAKHPAMPIGGLKISVANGGKTMLIQPPRPLAAGTYQLKWHAVAGDTHRISGAFSFTVK
jgi:methionine-rich copper-binding protein CopC